MGQIIIVDFGSQYTFLIAKRIRKLGYYCEIVSPYSVRYDDIIKDDIKLVVLSGGPQSVYDSDVYVGTVDEIGRIILDTTITVVGICFGLQYICHFLNGGKVVKGERGEYGKATLFVNSVYRENPFISWMFEDTIKRKHQSVDGTSKASILGYPSTEVFNSGVQDRYKLFRDLVIFYGRPYNIPPRAIFQVVSELDPKKKEDIPFNAMLERSKNWTRQKKAKW